MKKLIYTITTAIFMIFFTVCGLSAQDDLNYIDASPEDSSHMETTINLGEEEVPADSNQNYLLLGAVAVLVIAGAAIVIAKKKKK